VTTIPTTATTKNVLLSQSPSPGSKIGPGATFDFQITQ
jgi:hypothetical protein